MFVKCSYIVIILVFINLLVIQGQDDNLHVHFILFTQDGRVELTSKTLDLIDNTKPSVFIIHGFFADITIDVFLLNITKTYRDNKNHNAIFVDWGRSSFDNYSWLVYEGVPRVGAILGAFIMQLYEHGLDLKRVHLVGQSLGAHIAGFAGRYINENHPRGEKIGRISGLDPAGPLYWKVLTIFENPYSLRASDADVVDCIHSNGGYLGTANNIGTVDFLVNGGSYQEYCGQFNSSFRFISEHICNHAFSSIFYQVTIGSKEYKASKSADSCQDVIVFGDQFDGNASGVYYVLTENNYPFKSIC